MKRLDYIRVLIPQGAGLSRADGYPPELLEEITDLMAEALFQDFQAHRRATVQSPQGPNHRILLTGSPDKIK